MAVFELSLYFEIPVHVDAETCRRALAEAYGVPLIWVGPPRFLHLEFLQSARSRSDAIMTAVLAIRRAIPGARRTSRAITDNEIIAWPLPRRVARSDDRPAAPPAAPGSPNRG